MKIKWTRRALNSLDSQADYIAQDNPQAAMEMVSKIMTAVDLLSSYPSMGRAGRVSGTRELIIPDTPFIVPYRIKNACVEVLRVFHTSQKWPSKP